jgi:membrane protein DedA with SNARE-associated domain
VAPVPGRERGRGIIWAGAFTVAAYLAGATLRRVSGTIAIILVAVAVAVIAGVIVAVRRQAGKLAARAEAAYPGPLD